MGEQKPTWHRDGDFLRTTYAGFSCCVTDPTGKSHSWRWKVEKGFGQNWEEGFVESLAIAQACALRTVEALAMLARCKKGDPPESSGFLAQFSATDATLPNGWHFVERDGYLCAVDDEDGLRGQCNLDLGQGNLYANNTPLPVVFAVLSRFSQLDT